MRLPLVVVLLCCVAVARAAEPVVPIERAPARDEGDGPHAQLILRGVTIVNGTGSPSFGPVDLVIERERITQVAIIGSAGSAIVEAERPALKPGGRELELSGHYVLPGLIDLHGHIGGTEQGTPAEYVYKLWLGHGITTVRDPGCGNGIEFCVTEARRSAANEITAPRIFPYVFFGQGHDPAIATAAEARAWVRTMKRRGALGVKCFGYRPEILQAAFDE